jgi:hypothetical protein
MALTSLVMNQLSNEDFAQAVEHMSALLVSEDLIRTPDDEAALLTAMERIAQKLAADDSPKPQTVVDSRARTPNGISSRTNARTGDCRAKCENRMDAERRRQYQAVVSSMRDKPSIDAKSRRMVKDQEPLYKRARELVMRRKEKIREMQFKQATETLKKELGDSGYKPHHTSTRSLNDFHSHVLVWLQKRNSNLAALQEEKTQLEQQTLKSRPSISPYSRKLSTKVRAMQLDRPGDITERLYRGGRQEKEKPDLPFRPVLSSSTLQLTKSRPKTPVHERLYSLCIKPEQRSATPNVKRSRSPIRQGDSCDLSFEKTYKINVNRGLAGERQGKGNEIAYGGKLGFLWRTVGKK